MRRHQQRQILELLKTIEEAQTAGLYADCQQGALTIGEFIENIEGEGTETVKLLEEYCDRLFQASNGEIGERALIKQLLKIQNSICNELKPNRVEVAFLPYSASMWDSLESIYLTAADDPDCDAYVVPIPSYELDYQSKSLGQMHYDGDKYPPDIPVTDWQKYDIEERRPDIIFTHYAYDDNVTNMTIHPAFYSKRLRELCLLLVYVPYFVMQGETIPDYYSFLPGVIFADRIMLQSETARRQYMKYYKLFEEKTKHAEKLGTAEEKFVAIGSPKFDKIINTKKEDCELPPQWRNLIENKDGTKKRVVLYNTHMWAWINGGKRYFKKLHHVLDWFKKQDGIVLWWRPHPNTEANLRVKQPQLLDEYFRTVDTYKKEAYGIYDDTPGLHRAIACTDIYYGDRSSLVTMYGITGKPAVFQEVDNTDGDISLCFIDFAFDDAGMAWSFDIFRDGLFEINLKNNTARYAARSGINPQYQGKEHFNLHRFVQYQTAGDEIICFPYYHTAIYIYNRSTGETQSVALDKKYLLSPASDGFCIRSAVRYKDNIYCFCVYSRAVIIFNITGRSVTYDTDFYGHTGLTCVAGSFTYTKYPIYISNPSGDGTVTLILRGCESLISYNLQTREVKTIATNPMLAQCPLAERVLQAAGQPRAETAGNGYWLITEAFDKLIHLNPATGQAKLYNTGVKNLIEPPYNLSTYVSITDCGEYLLLLPGYGSDILRFDKKTEQFGKYTGIPVPDDITNTTYKFELPVRAGGKLYINARYNSTIYELDIMTGSVTEHKVKMDDESRERYIKDYMNDYCTQAAECADGALIMADGYGLDNILNIYYDNPDASRIIDTRSKKLLSMRSANTDGTAGRDIYQEAKQLLILNS